METDMRIGWVLHPRPGYAFWLPKDYSASFWLTLVLASGVGCVATMYKFDTQVLAQRNPTFSVSVYSLHLIPPLHALLTYL